jgi:hypothetical protein
MERDQCHNGTSEKEFQRPDDGVLEYHLAGKAAGVFRFVEWIAVLLAQNLGFPL